MRILLANFIDGTVCH